ncbi:putative UPF0481 protein [Iris pallida]|uniref:UPF0481 protein n=1 Tax=Iris pallida TaxID=29817 RepID=A0AAX6HDB0_IRIPA|nr:putative UPF0481 protein [Iris pallida]
MIGRHSSSSCQRQSPDQHFEFVVVTKKEREKNGCSLQQGANQLVLDHSEAQRNCASRPPKIPSCASTAAPHPSTLSAAAGGSSSVVTCRCRVDRVDKGEARACPAGGDLLPVGQALHLPRPQVPLRRRREGLRPPARLPRPLPPRQAPPPPHGAAQVARPPPGPPPHRPQRRALPRGREVPRRESPLALRGGHHPDQQRVRPDHGPRRHLRARDLPRRGRGGVPGAGVLPQRPHLRDARHHALGAARHDHAGEPDPPLRAGPAAGAPDRAGRALRPGGEDRALLLRDPDAHRRAPPQGGVRPPLRRRAALPRRVPAQHPADGPEARAEGLDPAALAQAEGRGQAAAAADPLRERAEGGRVLVPEGGHGQVLGHPVQGRGAQDPPPAHPPRHQVPLPQPHRLRAVPHRLRQRHHLLHRLHGQPHQLRGGRRLPALPRDHRALARERRGGRRPLQPPLPGGGLRHQRQLSLRPLAAGQQVLQPQVEFLEGHIGAQLLPQPMGHHLLCCWCCVARPHAFTNILQYLWLLLA